MRPINGHERVVQIMPAVGWWAVYGEPDGTLHRCRLVGFALVESWLSPEPRPDEIERLVKPLASADYIDTCDGDENFLALVHDDEWNDARARIEAMARERAGLATVTP